MITVERLGARGDGIAGEDYFPFTAPGDRVDPDTGDVVPGPNRQDPPCPHFGICGGCAMQHLDDATYRAWLGDRIAMALAQHRLEAEIAAPHVSPPGARRRAALTAGWQGGRLALGFAAGRSHDIVDLRECPVLRPELAALLAPLRAVLGAQWPKARRARLEVTLTDSGADLRITGYDAGQPAHIAAWARLAAAHDIARIAGEEIVVQRRAPTVRLGPATVGLPPGGFLQATADGEAALAAFILANIGQPRRVADLFAGIGTFSFPLARQCAVHAVEGARDATLAMRDAARGLSGVKPVTVAHRDLFRRPLTAAELKAYDAIVLDPPRAGAKAQCAALAGSPVPTVIAISCNPNTFARDARMLVDGGYRLGIIQPVGQFLWSREVELATRFTRDA